MEAAKGGKKPKRSMVTVEVMLGGQGRMPKRSGMTVEVMLDGQWGRPRGLV